jgi:anti-anti-sigma factor
MPTTATITVNSLENSQDMKVVHVTGELDESNLPQFEQAVTPLALDPTIKVLVFNFMGLQFMNSKVIGYFAYLYSTMSRTNRKMIFACYNQTIHDIMTLVGLDKLVDSEATLEGAIQKAYSYATPNPSN